MRTDVKIGIACGLVVIAGFAIYLVVNSGDEQIPDTPDKPTSLHIQPPVTDDPGSVGDGGIDDGTLSTDVLGTGATDSAWGPGVDVPDSTGGPDTTGAIDTPEPGSAAAGGIGIPDPATGGPDTSGGTSGITMIPDGPVDPDTGAGTFTPAVGDSSVAPVDPGTPANVPYPDSTGVITGVTDPVVGSPIGAGRTHVIKSGDQLWKIAEMYYDSGRHWQLIVAANPGLNPTAMPIGKTINIPPRPATTGGTRVLGTPTLDPSVGLGEKVYVVRDGDSGMWGVSESQYGHGKYYTAIANRNPNVDSARLKIGQKLIIPSLEQAKAFLSGGSSTTGTPAIGGVTGPATLAPLTAPGEKLYTVRDGDSGLWGVSKSQYGNGKYYPAIANRNPGVNPAKLKIGQKLVIPSIEQAKAFVSGSSPRPAVGGRPIPAPRPRVTPRPRPVPRRPAPVSDSDEPDFS